MRRKPKIKGRKFSPENIISPPSGSEEKSEPEISVSAEFEPAPVPVRLWEHILISGLLVAAVFGAFFPALENGWIWDDAGNYVENYRYRGLSSVHLKWIFTTTFPGHYQPLTWLTHSFDYLLWGMDPFGYHLGNVVLHAGNAVLLYFLILSFFRLNPDWKNLAPTLNLRLSCAAGALFFALHPLRVESVAWITERRDVLSGFFYLLTLICYLRIYSQPGKRSAKAATLALLFFILSLLAKPWGITLPAVLLILDAYPLGRITFEKGWFRSAIKLLVEKIPFILVAAAFAFVAIIAQEGWSIRTAGHGWLDRCIQAAYGLCFYPFKTLVPINLSPLYLLPHDFDPFEFKYMLSAFIAPTLTLGLIFLWRRRPWAFTAWLCYAAIVSPVLGLVQSGNQIAADRYTYLSCLPFAILAGAGLYTFCSKGFSKAGFAAATAILVVLGILANLQSRLWKDRESLWNHALKIDPANYIGYDNRAPAFTASGDLANAMSDYDEAIRLNPDFADAYYGRGGVWDKMGNLQKSLMDYNKAIELNPEFLSAYNNRGNVRQALGDQAGGLEDYSKAISLKKGFFYAYVNRGLLHQKLGDFNRARADLEMAVKINPNYADSFYNRGGLLEAIGNREAALRDYGKAIELNPQYKAALLSRAMLLAKSGRPGAALADYSQLAHLEPDGGAALLRKGKYYEKLGRTEEAMRDYSEAIREDPSNPQNYNIRAALREKMDDAEGAMQDYDKAIRLDPDYLSAYNKRGTLKQKHQNFQGALDDFNKAVELDTANPISYYNRGNLHLLQGDMEKALENYDTAINLDPNYANAYGNRGNVRQRQGDLQEAIEDFSRALDVAPARWANRKKVEQLLRQARKSLEAELAK